MDLPDLFQMEKENKPFRDEKGDLNFGDHKFDWDKFRLWQGTYVFHFYNEERNHHFPYFGLFSHDDEAYQNAIKDPDYAEVSLYHTPENPPFDFFIKYHNWQLSLLVIYFKEVFEEKSFLYGYHPQNKYFRLILPKTLHYKILNVINDYELLLIRDLILELIAIAQDIYVDDVFHWEGKEMQAIINTAVRKHIRQLS